MFKLEQSIAEWRQQMLAGGIKTPVLMDELESHLRDDMERQMRSGLNEQQAFEIAVQHIGQAHALKVEFEKAGRAIETRLVQLAGIACASIACLFSLWLLPYLFHHEIGLTAKSFGLVGVALTILSWRYGHRLLPVIRSRRVRTVIGIAGCLGGVAWMSFFIKVILPHFLELPAGVEVPLGQLFVSFLWAWTLVAVLGGIGRGLEKAASRRTLSHG